MGMKTRTPKPEEMLQRVARFGDLKPIAAQREDRYSQDILDLLYARKLLPVVGLGSGEATAVSDSAPIVGAGGMTITYAVCPPGQGPSLHAHKLTYETFTVLRGKFEFAWGDNGEHTLELDELDVLSVPPEVCRAFRNISEEEGVLQVIITGGVHDMQDIDMSPDVGRKIKEIDPEAYDEIADKRFTFTAGDE
jgi:quercetin dioxygenase-like cupin family protein